MEEANTAVADAAWERRRGQIYRNMAAAAMAARLAYSALSSSEYEGVPVPSPIIQVLCQQALQGAWSAAWAD